MDLKIINDIVSDIVSNIPDDQKETLCELPEDEFAYKFHHGAGTAIRNDLGLWFDETPISKFFQSIDINHGDDRSGILMTCVHRKLKNEAFEIEDQKEKYITHWKAYGFVDGIYKNEN